MKKFLFSFAALSLVGALYGCDKEESCSDDMDCPGAQVCGTDKVCHTPGGGGTCTSDAQCGLYACDIGGTNKCMSDCVSIEDCAQGAECSDAGFCVVGNGGNHTYSSVLIVSRTPFIEDAPSNSDCGSNNPGPDIDFVEVLAAGAGVGPASTSGAHGASCDKNTNLPAYWAPPSAAMTRNSIPNEIPGFCTLNDGAEKSTYFFLGSGQAYTAGETIGDKTGYLIAEFADMIQDGDQIKVWEVNGNDGVDGEVCENITNARPSDIYGVYLVSDKAPSVGVGTKLEFPNFISLGDKNGVGVFNVELD